MVELPAKLRNYQFDVLRVLAIVLVLVIHSANRYAITVLEQTIGGWLVLYSRPAIAIFLFLSGALFVSQPNTYLNLRQRLSRVVYPYLTFSVFALYFEQREAVLQTLAHQPLALMQRLLFGNTFGVYYFVFVIVCMYLIGFMARFYIKNERQLQRMTLAALALMFIHHLIGRKVYEQFGIFSDEYFFYADRSPLVWAGYFFLGMLYQQMSMQSVIDGYRVRLRFVWVSVFILYNVLYFSGTPIVLLEGYHSVVGSIYAIATVGMLLTYTIRSSLWTLLSSLTYYLYLSHIFFVYGLANLVVQYKIQPSLWLGLISFAVSFTGPLACYWLLKRLVPRSTKLLVGA